MSLITALRGRFDASQLDVLSEIVNIGVGRSAASLSELIGARIELQAPEVRHCTTKDHQTWQTAVAHESSTLIVQYFRGPVSGKAGLLFDERSSLLLAQLLANLDTPPDDLDIEMSGTLLEVGNIVLNAVLGSLSNQMRAELSYSIPMIVAGRDIADDQEILTDDGDTSDLLLADIEFGVAEHAIHGSIVIAFALGSVEELLASVGELL
ncbi:hypothetical protein [Planctellipticum variicoloris]|uniref:hypothetical protein n=1 Tax=Planctellipticum variicoloris TaxID=3064265 RepID=UPI002B78E230|nr:hypothetical protein SH412_000626 [Planctomycetaceae bacterium SH412]HTN00307.1 hypothetical protein [Planctomycetaceae bacterium]